MAAAILASMLSACRSGSDAEETLVYPEGPAISAEQAVLIARREAGSRGWPDASDETRTRLHSARLENGRWMIGFEWLPAMPSGHVVVFLTRDGKFLEAIPGA